MIVRIDGDGVTCAFGYPKALDDAGRRATEAALDLHAAMAALNQSFTFPDQSIRLHSGVHSGVVLVREGDLVRGRIEILGDTTNVAARLCDHAEPDQIVVSEASLGGDRHFFLAEGGIAVPVKGRKTPIAALLISGRDEAETRFAARSKRGMAPFCGRDHEMKQLGELLEKCRSGDRRGVIVIGPPGIGKTRLLSRFLDVAIRKGIAVHRGYCESYLGARPLQPFEQIAQSLADSATGGDTPARVLNWARNSAEQLAILAIDDWQWADDASHLLLGEIIRNRPGYLLILLASRPDRIDAPELDGFAQVQLGPLSESESDAAISGLLHSIDPFRAERIRRLSGGSPLYIEELCHAQAAHFSSQVASDSSVWLDTLVHARFLELPERQADLVRTASVIGHMIPLGLFAAVTGIDASDPILDELNASDFLYRGDITGTLRFKHALTRDAIYRTVGFDERQRLHALVAERLEALAGQEGEDEHVDALAYHHAACGNAVRAIGYAIKAGDRAMQVVAQDRAQAHFRLGLDLAWASPDLAIPPETRISLIHKYGAASAVDPVTEQVEVFSYVAAQAAKFGDMLAGCYATYWLGATLYGVGRSVEAIETFKRCQLIADQLGIESLKTQIEANLGQAYVRTGEFDLAMRYLDSSTIKLAQSSSSRSRAGLAYALGCKGQVLSAQGYFEEAQMAFDRAEATVSDQVSSVFGSLYVKRHAAMVLQGKFQNAIDYGTGSIEFNLQIRSRFNSTYSQAMVAYSRFRLDPIARHVEEMQRLAEWFRESGSLHSVSKCFAWLSEILYEVREPELAADWADRAWGRCLDSDRTGEIITAQVMARLAADGRLKRTPEDWLAIAYAAAAQHQSRQYWAKTVMTEVEVTRSRDLPGPLLAKAKDALAAFRQMEMPYYAERLDRHLTGL
jgi:tetratricopeptide (TPR) repeat protein